MDRATDVRNALNNIIVKHESPHGIRLKGLGHVAGDPCLIVENWDGVEYVVVVSKRGEGRGRRKSV